MKPCPIPYEPGNDDSRDDFRHIKYLQRKCVFVPVLSTLNLKFFGIPEDIIVAAYLRGFRYNILLIVK